MSNNNNKQEIENLLIEYLNEYESLITLREQYNSNLKNGYFLITKSRYSMGGRSLSQLQYPESIKSTFNLSMPTNESLTYESKNDNFISIHYKNIDSNKDNNNNNNNSIVYNNKSSTSSNNTNTTRRRNIPNPTITTSKDGVTTMGSLENLLKSSGIDNNDYSDSDSENDDDNTDSDDDNENNNNNNENNNNNQNDQEKIKEKMLKKKLKENKKIIKKDPIYWFGISTPASLKQSQNYFKQAISQSIEISNKLIKMEIIYKKYTELLEK